MDCILPIDIFHILHKKIDFKTKLNLMATCKYFEQQLPIRSLSDIGINKFTNNILKQKKYTNIKKLNLSKNYYHIDISHLTNLQSLNCNGTSITQKSIEKLNLRKLFLNNNTLINNISHMTNLIVLKMCGKSRIRQNLLDELNLFELRCGIYIEAYNFSHMSNLKILYASHYRVNNESIKKLDLHELYIEGNVGITNIMHLRNLKILDITGNTNIIEIPSSVKKLFASFSAINQQSIKNLDLLELDVSYAPLVTNILHMTNLTKLSAVGDKCSLTNDSIPWNNLKDIDAYGNYNINVPMNMLIYNNHQ